MEFEPLRFAIFASKGTYVGGVLQAQNSGPFY